MNPTTATRGNILLGPEHTCAYLPPRKATIAFFDPADTMRSADYDGLAEAGFRRSGSHVYRPACGSCRECVPVRVPVRAFRPNRAQRRTWKHMQRVTVRECAARFEAEHYELYLRYQQARHPDSSMANCNQMEYMAFLSSGWSRTRFIEFRVDGRLLAIAVTDYLARALSAVYTFFEPEAARLSPGTLAVLQQIRLAREAGLEWLYLGYWIRDCRKMRYKTAFRPLETFRDGDWIRVGTGPMPDFTGVQPESPVSYTTGL